jgi:hypothetical protein
LSVSGPATRISDETIVAYGDALQRAAAGVEEQMGYGKRAVRARAGAAAG